VADNEPVIVDKTPPENFDTAWQEVRADADIQFFPFAKAPPPETPQWLKDLAEFLVTILEPVGRFLLFIWPVLKWVLVGAVAFAIIFLLWKIIAPYVEEWRNKSPLLEHDEWVPDERVARQLLEEADALAAEGKYEEAAHLLLFRSIDDIESNQPNVLRPSNTSREIVNFDSLPHKASDMFAVIVGHVERGIFAASPIGEEGWVESRQAYGEFALAGSWSRLPAGGGQ